MFFDMKKSAEKKSDFSSAGKFYIKLSVINDLKGK